MKSIITVCTALLLGSTALAAPATLATQSGPVVNGGVVSHVPLVPTCAAGFKYSVKEQFGGPTGHLWFICKTPPILCPGTISASVQDSGSQFRFVYRCLIATANIAPGCATGFTKGSTGLAANISSCSTALLSCPANFMKMKDTDTVSADKRTVEFEYQCYRPA